MKFLQPKSRAGGSRFINITILKYVNQFHCYHKFFVYRNLLSIMLRNRLVAGYRTTSNKSSMCTMYQNGNGSLSNLSGGVYVIDLLRLIIAIGADLSVCYFK